MTPLQMAMVAATIGNHGASMRPQLIERVVSPSGKTITHLKPDQLGRPIKRQTADELTRMMELVVTGGTGTAAADPGYQRRRQDRHRGGGARQHPHDVVRGLRARERTRGSRSPSWSRTS